MLHYIILYYIILFYIVGIHFPNIKGFISLTKKMKRENEINEIKVDLGLVKCEKL